MSFNSHEDKVNLAAINIMANSLQESGNPKISETYFANRWLSMFLEREFGNRDKVIVNAWVIEVAGNASNAVDITDNSGKIVATIPPIVGSTKIVKHKTSREAFSNIAAEAVLHNQTIPGTGDKLLSNAAKKLELINYDSSDKFWLDLFAYFKVDLKAYVEQFKKPNEKVIGSNSTTVVDNNKDFDMGDFNDD